MTQTPGVRRTREQSRLETRRRLIAAAHAAIVRGGIGAVSLRAVCEAAGYSQGAFYSNFSSRDALLLALMHDHLNEEVATLQSIVRSAQGESLETVLSTLAARLAVLARDTQWSLLAIELQLHAQRHPTFAIAYDGAKMEFHAAFALIVEGIVQRHGLAPVMPPLQIAVGLYALWSGLVAQGAPPGAWPRDEIFLAFLCAAIGAPRPSGPSDKPQRAA